MDIGPIGVPFNVINNVEFLHISSSHDPYLQMHDHVDIFKAIPLFSNLIHIELWFNALFHGWDCVVELLCHCRKLQIVFIRKVC